MANPIPQAKLLVGGLKSQGHLELDTPDGFGTTGLFLDRGGAVCNVRHPAFGVIGDGLADDTAALQAAADQARALGVPVLIPPGEYRVTKRVVFYTDIICHGVIVLDSGAENANILIARTSEGETVPTAGLGGLTRGSNKITGLVGRKGQTLRLTSTEKLIERYAPGTSSGDYTKNEVVSVISDEGDIWPPLDSTYDDLGKLTITAYPAEPTLRVEGLRIDPRNVGTNNSLFTIRRSWVVVDRLVVEVPTNQRDDAFIGVDLRDAVGVVLYAPRVAGFRHTNTSGTGELGYAIHGFATAFTVIHDGMVTDSRRGFAGRHNKEVHILGGYYNSYNGRGAVDSHWCNVLHVRGATLDSIVPGALAVAAAGSNVLVEGCRFLNCRGIASIRGDTPQLAGYFIARDNFIEWPAGEDCYLIGFIASTDDYGSTFSNTVQWPDYVEIRNNFITNNGATDSYIWRDTGARLNRTQIKRMVIDGNHAVGESPRKVAPLLAFRVSADLVADTDPVLEIRNQKFSRDFNTLRINGEDPASAGYLFNVRIDNSGPLMLMIRSDTCRSIKVADSLVYRVRGMDAGPQTPTCAVELDGCELGDTMNTFEVYRSAPQLEFRHCRFRTRMAYISDPGAVQNHNSRRAATRASIGNVAAAGIEAVDLPPLDNFVDPTHYAPEEGGRANTSPVGVVPLEPITRWGHSTDITSEVISDTGEMNPYGATRLTATANNSTVMTGYGLLRPHQHYLVVARVRTADTNRWSIDAQEDTPPTFPKNVKHVSDAPSHIGQWQEIAFEVEIGPKPRRLQFRLATVDGGAPVGGSSTLDVDYVNVYHLSGSAVDSVVAPIRRFRVDGWHYEGVAAGLSATEMVRVGGGFNAWVANRAGEVRALWIKSNEPRVAGKLTVRLYRNGVDTGARVELDETNTTFAVAEFESGRYQHEAADELSLYVESSADWAPVTAVIQAGIEVDE